jgi:hypothetical protein
MFFRATSVFTEYVSTGSAAVETSAQATLVMLRLTATRSVIGPLAVSAKNLSGIDWPALA